MTQATSHRTFEPGTTGWTVDDLSDPEIQWQWSEGRYEIVEGVLTETSPQGIQKVRPLHRLRRLIERHLDSTKQSGEFYAGVELLLRPSRVLRPDLVFLAPDQLAHQQKLEVDHALEDNDYRPLYVMPNLVIESVSAGHEAHDRVTKRQWYLEAGISNYWLLTAGDRSLHCLAIQNGSYVQAAFGKDNQTVHTPAFGGMTIPLAELWRKQ